MFHSSHYPRSRLFDGEGSRSKTSLESASHSIRQPPSNHPPSIVAPEYPNIEMLEASQLSMDSDLRAYSQSSNFVDVPLGQPSASMSSFSSSHEQRYYPHQVNQHHSSHYNDGEGRGARRSTTMPRMSQSSFSGGSIKSSLRKKTNDAAKKTRFAGVRDSRVLLTRRSSSQGSCTPPSQSSSQEGSQCTSRSSRRTPLQRTTPKMHNTNRYHRPSHLGRSLNVLPQQQQNPIIEAPNASRRLSPTAGLQEPMFSRVATPLKPLNIPYPPIKFHPRNRRPSPVQPTKPEVPFGYDIDFQNDMSNCRNDSERPPDEMMRDGATKRSDKAQELYEDEEGGISEENTPIARQDTTLSNTENHRERQRMDAFKTHLEKLLTEAKAVQKELKAKLDEGVATIQEASKSNLDMIQQKRDEAETAIESLHKSKTAQLKDTACASVQKVEACTETSLSKLKKFTESWLSTSCNAIANRLKPYLGSSTKVDATKIQNGDIGCHTPIKREQRKTGGSVLNSSDKNRLKRKSGALLGGSSKTHDDAEQSSSTTNKGEMSGTQRSGGTSRGGSTRTLRRSKRTKQRKDQKGDPTASQNTTSTTKTPRSEKKHKKKSPTTATQEKKAAERSTTSQPSKFVKKSERVLCVTPTEGNSRPLKKDRTKPTTSSSSSLKKSKPEINRLKPLRSRRKRQKTPSLSSTKKRLKVNLESSQPSVPSEVVAFGDVQLSPLEGPNLFSLPYTKTKSESSFGKKKRKSSPTKTFGRKKMTFDVMDNDDVFHF